MTPTVPTTASDITAAWLNQALAVGSHPCAEVRALTIEPLGPSVGLLGDLARLHIEYTATESDNPEPEPQLRPATMIAKLPTAEPGGHQVGNMLRAWAREVAFYRQVAPVSPGVRLPRCYYADGDPEAEAWVVILEDCAHQPIDASKGADFARAERAVEALAEFHAIWWQAEQAFDWMPGFDGMGVGGLKGPWLDAIPIFLERYGHLIPEPTGDWLQRFAPVLDRWSDRAAAEPLTIVHADYRLDNLLFSDTDVTMIDWQTALRGPGAMDLSCFLVTALTVDDRRTHEAALIDRYLERLASAGITVDRHWFSRSYDENLLWWMGQFANNLARLHPEEQATQRALDTMIERTYTAAHDHNVGRLLD